MRRAHLLPAEHFTVDATLIEAWASLTSFRPKDETAGGDPPPPDDPGNPTVNFHGGQRSNATHAAITDSDALSMSSDRVALAEEGELGQAAPRSID